MKIVIVGGVAAGASAAARIRRLNEKAEIIIIEKSGHISYANCGLPYYAGGVIEDERALTLQTPDSFRRRFNIDARVNSEAVDIDTDKKTVRVKDNAAGKEYALSYDKLLIATGASAAVPKIEGLDKTPYFTLKTVEDAVTLKKTLVEKRPKSALILGGGYIGLECAENLCGLGISVTVLQADDYVLPVLDADMAVQAEAYLKEKGLNLVTGAVTKRFSDNGDEIEAVTNKGSFKGELLIVSAGVRPDTALALKAGIECGERGAVITDAFMRTSAPDVYAAGDAVLIKNSVTGQKAYMALAGPANRQGRIAADNMCGLKSEYIGAQSSSVIKLFGMTVAVTGLTEKTAVAAGVSYDKVVNFSLSHAGYYPDASNMTIKTLFSPCDGKILGAQLLGFDGVDKRADVLATAIRAGFTARDLAELDLVYAPPYSSAKDPVNMAGYTACNILDGLVRQFHWHDVKRLQGEGAFLLDVRTTAEFERGHIEGAVNIPLDELRGRTREIPKDKPVYVNCHSGLRSYLACRILSGHGYDCLNLSGGYRFYSFTVGLDYGFEFTPACGVK